MITRRLLGPVLSGAICAGGAALVDAQPERPAMAAGDRLVYTLPAAWTRGEQQGLVTLTPSGATPDTAVLLVLTPVQPLGSRALEGWLGAVMDDDLRSGAKALQSSPLQRGRAGALETVSAGRTIQRAEGVLLQVYYAISDGRRAGLAMVVAGSEAALSRRMTDVQAIVQSLELPREAGPAASGAPAAPMTPAAKQTVSPTDVVGTWEHASSSHTSYSSAATGAYAGSTTAAYGQGYTFAADGTYTYRFTGMMNSVYVREQDSGTWAFEAGRLVIRSREGRRPKAYQIVSYETGPDGRVTMTLLSTYYPITDSNVAVWGERFTRGPR